MSASRLNPGDPAPDFELSDQDGNVISLRSLRPDSVVLFCYPAAMTPGCTREACDFRDSSAALTEAGYRVLGLSPDTPEKLRAFRERDGLGYPLLSDPQHTVLEAFGAWGEKKNYGRTFVGVIRSTFVINAEGTIEHALYNVRATGHVQRVRTLLGV